MNSYQVTIYNPDNKLVRVFPGYRTERDAEGFAKVLRSQAHAYGWAYRVKVEVEVPPASKHTT